jgi:hypothetical protein
MATLTFPRTVLPVGVTSVGPLAVADADTAIQLTNDRTVAGGLNSLNSSTGLLIFIEQSDDGGTTWDGVAGNGLAGGILLNKTGGTVTQDQLTTTMNPGTSRQLRLTATVTGPSAVAVAGTLTTT